MPSRELGIDKDSVEPKVWACVLRCNSTGLKMAGKGGASEQRGFGVFLCAYIVSGFVH